MLLTGGGALDILSERAKPFPWLPDNVWLNVLQLSRSVPTFRDLPESIIRNDQLWKHWYDEDAPEQQRVPDYEERLGTFDKLLLVRSIREDRALLCVSEFIVEVLGKRYVDSRPLDLRALHDEADKFTPMIVLLSMGADPTNAITELARRKKKQVRAISMGQGQEPAARKLLTMGTQQGSWVLLQNCHLGLKMMEELENYLQGRRSEPDEVQDDFRLWITCEPHPRFPIGLLQISIKATNEAPAGIRAGLKGSYAWLTQDHLDAITGASATTWKTMLYALCFMHSIVQERRKFGPLGFNVPYEFNQSDLSACVQFIQNHITDVEAKKRPVDFPTVNYMVCEVQYGGRITDDWDRRMVLTLLMSIIQPRILDDDFPLAKSPAFPDAYISPEAGSHARYQEKIKSLPINPHPNVFGLHENADIACAQAETQELCDIMLSLQPKVSTGGGKSKDDVVRETAVALKDRNFVPFDLDEMARVYPLSYGESMNTVLVQEAQRYVKLIQIYNSSLAELLKALKGLVVMSADLESMHNSLYTNAVPAIWTKKSYPSLKPLAAWVDDLAMRLAFIKNWQDKGTPPAYWISGFFFPQAFLTGTLQNYARKYAVAIDTVDFDFVILKEMPQIVGGMQTDITVKPDDGCYIYGAFLEGARWDVAEHCLAESRPKELFVDFPAIHLNPKVGRQTPKEGVYSCPMYKTTVRAGLLSTTGHSTNFVLMVEVPSKEACSGNFHKYIETYSAHWILRAVALFTTLSY
uniref:Dynein heavy chain n=1 Tax=Prymnesium polylepis TaxID=72548 RepID=A0A7S4KKQ0_9EUKA